MYYNETLSIITMAITAVTCLCGFCYCVNALLNAIWERKRENI